MDSGSTGAEKKQPKKRALLAERLLVMPTSLYSPIFTQETLFIRPWST